MPKQLGFTKEFRHSGLGYSKRRGAVIVDNNAVSKSLIPATTIQQQAKNLSTRSVLHITNPTQSSYTEFDKDTLPTNRINSHSISSRNNNNQNSAR